MFDFSSIYLPVKAFHLISLISWMAGIFYLPRLFVYHAEKATLKTDFSENLKIMEHKLYSFIMTPAMIATWLFGIILILIPGIVSFSDYWIWIKIFFVVVVTVFHFWLGKCLKRFKIDQNHYSGRVFRIANEVPTVAMIIIVFMVVLKPF